MWSYFGLRGKWGSWKDERVKAMLNFEGEEIGGIVRKIILEFQ